MAQENIILEHEKGIATIFINRPEKLNALNKATIQELHETIQLIDKNPEVRVIIITGSGEKAFVAGADIAEFAHFSAEEGAQLSAKGQELLFDFIESLKTPVIAAINGFALGGGLELAMACHFRIASENGLAGNVTWRYSRLWRNATFGAIGWQRSRHGNDSNCRND